MDKLISSPVIALVALLLAGNLAWWVQARGLRADVREAVAEQRVLETERESWKNKTGELVEANTAMRGIITALRADLEQAQGEARRLDAEGRAAIAAARADASAAERQLIAFRERYQRQRATPDCAGALEALQQHCTQFEGY